MRRKEREVTDIHVIMDILDKCKVASVAMVDDGLPYVVPLSYGYDYRDGTLVFYFHGAKEGRKLDIWRRDNRVCFAIFSEGEPQHMETPCNTGYDYSSVIGNGVVEIIEDLEERKYALSRMFAHQTGREVSFTDAQANAVCVFRIVSRDFAGKLKPKA